MTFWKIGFWPSVPTKTSSQSLSLIGWIIPPLLKFPRLWPLWHNFNPLKMASTYSTEKLDPVQQQMRKFDPNRLIIVGMKQSLNTWRHKSSKFEFQPSCTHVLYNLSSQSLFYTAENVRVYRCFHEVDLGDVINTTPSVGYDLAQAKSINPLKVEPDRFITEVIILWWVDNAKI